MGKKELAESIISDLIQPTRHPTMENIPNTPTKKTRAKATTKKRATRKDKGVKRDGSAEAFSILKMLYAAHLDYVADKTSNVTTEVLENKIPAIEQLLLRVDKDWVTKRLMILRASMSEDRPAQELTPSEIFRMMRSGKRPQDIKSLEGDQTGSLPTENQSG